MEPSEIEALIECLVADPHDANALARAHRQGEEDPQGYAYLLEQVGTRTSDASYASHWLSEAANIWSVTIGDAHRAARVLMIAVDRDPTQPLAADRLAQLYRDKGDIKALVAMLDRRVRLLTPMLNADPATTDSLRALIAALHDELGRLWSEPPLGQPRKAVDHYRRSIELDPNNALAIFSIRELYKALQQWDDAIAMYAYELRLEGDPQRRLMLFRDEAATRRIADDLTGVTHALRNALDEIRRGGGDDAVLAQEVASSLLDRAAAGAPLSDDERAYGADLLAGLAEAFGGEHGLAYARGALDSVPGHDRGMQLFAYYASAAGGDAARDDLALRYHAYLESNPTGQLAEEARVCLAASYEALGQVDQAIQVLEPLRGRPVVDRRLAALETGSVGMETPVRGIEEMEALATSARRENRGSETALGGAPTAPQDVKQTALDAARASLAKADKAGALDRYLDVLNVDPVEAEALAWVEDYLRTKRDYAKLRDVLWATARATGAQDSLEGRKLRLREIAGLSEGNLKDLDGAIQAWRQILSLDRGDDAARQALVRALEKGQKWDDLANLLEQEASTSVDVDVKIQLEKKLATLDEQKRNDLRGAAEAWARIARLTPADDHPISTAVELFERAGKGDLAAAVIDENADGITDVAARATLLDRLGGLLASAGDHAAAGSAYERATVAVPTVERLAAAEREFAEGRRWTSAAVVAERLGELAPADDITARADALARAAGYRRESGDLAAATMCLERANALAPDVESYALSLLESYRIDGTHDKLAQLLSVRGENHPDKEVRIAALREAAKLFEAMPQEVGQAKARSQWQKVLGAGEDAEALEHLVRIALDLGELAEGVSLLQRQGKLASTTEEKTAIAMREADLLARSTDGIGAAVERYEWVLETLDAKNRAALRAISDLEEKRGVHKAAANALERELALTTDAPTRRDLGTRLVRNYEAAHDDVGTFSALEAIREIDADDFDALNRLIAIAEKLERWEALVKLLADQIDVEADDEEISRLTQRRSAILADKLGKGDEALAALEDIADAGDSAVREAYVTLGDRLGWRGIVATKLIDWWFPETPSDARTAALKGAFERYSVVGRDADAVRVGLEILSINRDASLATQLEELAAKASNETALTAAQEILGASLSGADRATELVRQAEMRVRAGMAWVESVQHGETALGGLSPEQVEPLLARLAALIPTAPEIVDLYERQISRSRGVEAREKALLKAAQTAGERGELTRARTFFDLVVNATPSDATLDALVQAAKDGDGERDGLRRALAESLAHGGEGVRDGGRSRAGFLRRAALLAEQELHDVDQAFAWLTDALIAHANEAALDTLSALAGEAKAPRRIEEVLSRVLTEVFDGPLVRLLLARRAKVRKELLGDRVGAAADLKKLHDLSPNDEAIIAELSALLTEQGDHRAMIQLYEDQLLRSKDQAVRAELGRKVAQIWETEFADAREAADAWRRVLRLKPGDEEATQGLDRAKAKMLRKGPVASGPASTKPAVVAEGPVAVVPDGPVAVAPDGAAAVAAPDGPAAIAPDSPAVVAPDAPAALVDAPVSPAEAAVSPSLEPATNVRQSGASFPAPVAAPTPEAPPSLVVETQRSEQDPPAPAETATSLTDDAEAPQLERLLGSTDPFGEADTTHTSVDVRLTGTARRRLDGVAPLAATPAAGTPASNSSAYIPASWTPGPLSERPRSRPPPLPTPSEPSPPTSPERRADAPGSSGWPPASERALGRTEENAPVDLSGHTSDEGSPTFHESHRSGDVPADVLSATDLASLEDDDDDDVLVVDEFVEDVDDDYEDVAAPSKPHGPLPQ